MFKKSTNYFDLIISWKKINNPDYPYETRLNGKYLQIKLNNFPAEPMFSLLDEGNIISNFDDWPVNWKR